MIPFTHSFIRSLNKCLLNLLYVPGTVLGPEDIMVNKRDVVPALTKASV